MQSTNHPLIDWNTKTYTVIGFGELGNGKLQSEIPHNIGEDGRKLSVRKLFTDTPVPASTERLVRRLGTLADRTETIVDLFGFGVLGHGSGGKSLFVVPSGRIPDLGILPDTRVHLRDARGGHDVVTLGDDVLAVLGGRGKTGWDGDVGKDFSVNRAILR